MLDFIMLTFIDNNLLQKEEEGAIIPPLQRN